MVRDVDNVSGKGYCLDDATWLAERSHVIIRIRHRIIFSRHCQDPPLRMKIRHTFFFSSKFALSEDVNSDWGL